MRRTLALLLLLVGLSPGWAWAENGFSFEQVIQRARQVASSAYVAPTPIPGFMRELSYQAYQNIRFDPGRSLWRDSDSNFQVMLVPPGLYFTHSVAIHIVDSEGPNTLQFDRSKFVFTDREIEKRIPADIGYAGFKLTYPLQAEDQANQFLVFAGASYFRGVGRDNNFGISARGLAVNTGLASGEKFPSFTEFWLVRPAPDAEAMTVYALLDGEHAAGAYRFVVTPGKPTRVQVSTVLFPRKPIELLGVAPLTSMFFYGENTIRPVGEWRPQVHDSDGLLIHNGISDEWLWRPLINPKNLEMDYFQTENVRGFGLLQRDRSFTDFEDLEAMYHTRPSAWIEPEGDWGKGEVVLTQLPSGVETNDNIVAFWHPAAAPDANDGYRFSYTLSFGSEELAAHPLGKAMNTFLGHGDRIGGGDAKDAYRVVVDFAEGALDGLSAEEPVVGQVTALDGGELIEQFVEYNRPCGCWRLSLLARPAPGKSLGLRAYLSRQGETLTETWSYRLPADNDLLGAGG